MVFLEVDLIMKRYEKNELESRVAAKASFFRIYNLETQAGPREVVGRNSGNWLGAKVFPLFITNKLADRVKLKGRCSLNDFNLQVRKKWLWPNLEIGLLAIDRPITYVKYGGKVNIRTNYIYEIPGGIVDEGEKLRRAALREGKEELGFHPICSSTLIEPCPPDSGTHLELTQTEVALCAGGINPTVYEGIVPNKCRMVNLKDFPKFVAKCETDGILVDGLARAAYSQFISNFFVH